MNVEHRTPNVERRTLPGFLSCPDLKLSLFLVAPPRPRPLLQSTNYTNFHELLPPPRPLLRTTNFAPDYNFGAEKLREFENCNVRSSTLNV